MKMVEFRGIPSILVIFTKKAPETAFLVKIHPETHFSVPGTPKMHRKSIGFVGVLSGLEGSNGGRGEVWFMGGF